MNQWKWTGHKIYVMYTLSFGFNQLNYLIEISWLITVNYLFSACFSMPEAWDLKILCFFLNCSPQFYDNLEKCSTWKTQSLHCKFALSPYPDTPITYNSSLPFHFAGGWAWVSGWIDDIHDDIGDVSMSPKRRIEVQITAYGIMAYGLV